MKKYRADFVAKEIGAIGRTYVESVEFEAEHCANGVTDELPPEAVDVVYARFEHVSSIVITEVQP